MNQNKINIALLLGDPSGIGPELVTKLLSEEITDKANIIVIGEKNILENKEALSHINLESVEKIALKIDETRNSDRTVYVAGNGGSSSTASHFVNDLIKATINKDKNIIKAISLNVILFLVLFLL